ncbi:E3 ubiquitin-protein ligase ORTHRUS 2-like [Hordeum vulgare subsp. vulgare]|uniref:RING-type E3 ubiquitin transferase n=1 Tax=Hordeum vulgare subsp. vulgare TaxID=112509 RepID=A0A8I7B1W5_HORVV|nr:E3 ubiquitin-protein ligase ORTHRUS 2-like [Hordeum vulgare subsp. vulgare]
MPDLPCDGDGVCMVCGAAGPAEVELLRCGTCATPWHSPCLSRPPALADAAGWACPDCGGEGASPAPAPAAGAGGGSGLLAAIRQIEADATLSEQDKARRRQELLGGKGAADEDEQDDDDDDEDNALEIVGKNFSCVFCMKLPERPVTTPCGHNFCLKCFEKWVHSGKRTCGKCRGPIPSKMAEQPRINAALVAVIRMARTAKNAKAGGSGNPVHYIRNEARPDKAFTTDRAKKSGKANASSGQIFVTIAPDHFGPIPPENDPRRNLGVLVGETWEDRLECRQWGAHFPHVAGIAGQSEHGAQSVALSGGYIDDEDHGEWFLYTGSGGRDLSGNKRTNKEQSSDQKFDKMNAALRLSCQKGYPVRVVRSHKEKRSSYAPESGVRYDGVYRIEKCWRKIGVQGTYKVCRYLFVRCDNEPAPWTSDLHGDRPRPLPKIKELQGATDIHERKGSPSWDYDAKEGWKWVKPAPISKKPAQSGDPEADKQFRKHRKRAHMSMNDRLLKEFGCSICKNVMTEPVSTPCGHNFCKTCLLDQYDERESTRERSRNGRTLRAQQIVKKCPSCPTDICDFLKIPHINIEMKDLIDNLLAKAAKDKQDAEGSAEENGDEDALEKEEEDDSSLNEEENGDAAEKKTEEEEAVVKIVVEAKDDELKKHLKRKGGEEEAKDEKEIKTPAAAAPDVQNAAEEDAEMVENKEDEGAQKVQKKRKGRAEAATTAAAGGGKRKKASPAAAGGGKRKKASPAAAEGTPGGSPAAVSTPRRSTRSGGGVVAGGSPASRTRSNTKADN